MALLVIGFLLGIYGFARKVVKNEPLKGRIDSTIDNANKKLSLYKDKKPRQLFDNLLRISEKGILYSLILCFFTLLLPEKINDYLLLLVAPILLLCAALNLSISWIIKHNKTFKELFLNIHMIGVLFSPLIFHLLDFYLNTNGLLIRFFHPFHYIIESYGLISFQIFWLISVFTIFYFGMMVIAIPIYFSLYTLIFVSSYIIRILEKRIDGHIIDAAVGLISLIVLFLKFFT